MNKDFDVIIIGAGAAGMFCASLLGKSGVKTLVLEHNQVPGKKILISGGGRCNFTNLYSDPSFFLSENEHFCKSALSRYTPYDFIELVEKNQIKFFEKKLGQLFCENSAKDIVNMLINECQVGNVLLEYATSVESISYVKDHYNVNTTSSVGKKSIKADKLIIATGGLPITNIGASDFGLNIAKQFGHKIVPPRPALVPFKYQWDFNLAGVSLPVKVGCKEGVIEDDFLFTHRGMSGPAVLKISLYESSHDEFSIDWLPNLDFMNHIKTTKDKRGRPWPELLTKRLPKRMLDEFKKDSSVSKDKLVADLTTQDIEYLTSQIHSYKVRPNGNEGFRKAEVMAGGVSTEQLSSKTMESGVQPGLYFVGEVVDVTGQLGGHNFQWAWSSANAAAQGIIETLLSKK